jgi:predicted ribosome quality control (RQC) complex YloA/Tae2 family protein
VRLAPLSDAEIAHVVGELAPRLVGAVGGKAWLPDADTLVVELGRDRLLLSAHPRASRLHLAARAPAAGPPAPFAMLVRKHAGGRRLRALAAEPGERIVTLDFGEARLVAELTGPHANLFVIAAGVIAGALRRSHSTTRVLAAGHPYTPPPPAPADARWRGLVRFRSADEVAGFYDRELAALAAHEAHARAAAHLRREIERLGRRERALIADLERIAEAVQLRKLADLLLAHAAELPGRGARTVTVPDDFEDGAPLTFAVDPALDARQNAARFYRQHKRLSAGRRHADQRLAETRAARAALLARLAADDLPAPPPPPAARAREREARLPYREYQSADGGAIWVGRGAADNDALTFRHARGSDLWLHCRDAPGAHVVVPLRAGRPASEETFLDAATLAGRFSPLADEAQVDVLYTHVKNLRRPRGGAPGRVFTAEAKTVRVRLEPARLARLLAPGDGDPVAGDRTRR